MGIGSYYGGNYLDLIKKKEDEEEELIATSVPEVIETKTIEDSQENDMVASSIEVFKMSDVETSPDYGTSPVSTTLPTQGFDTVDSKINYYKEKIVWLEGISEEKGGLGESSYGAYRYAISQYNKFVNTKNEQINTNYKNIFKNNKHITNLPEQVAMPKKQPYQMKRAGVSSRQRGIGDVPEYQPTPEESREMDKVIPSVVKGLYHGIVTFPTVVGKLMETWGDVEQVISDPEKYIPAQGTKEEIDFAKKYLKATYGGDRFAKQHKQAASFTSEKGAELVKKNTEWASQFLPEEEASEITKWGFDLGSGAASLAESIGFAYLTGSSTVPSIMFGLQAWGSTASEAKEAGVEPLKASALGFINFVTEAGTEAVGLDFLFTKFNVGKVANLIIHGVGEGTQEVVQEASTNLIAHFGFDKSRKVMDNCLKSGVLGFVLGIGASATIDWCSMEHGVDKEIIAPLVEKAYQETLHFTNNIEYQDIIDSTQDYSMDDLDVTSTEKFEDYLDQSTEDILDSIDDQETDEIPDQFSPESDEMLDEYGIKKDTIHGTGIEGTFAGNEVFNMTVNVTGTEKFKDIEVIKNPTENQVKELIKEQGYPDIRFSQTKNGNVYAYKGMEAIHTEINESLSKKLDISESSIQSGMLNKYGEPKVIRETEAKGDEEFTDEFFEFDESKHIDREPLVPNGKMSKPATPTKATTEEVGGVGKLYRGQASEFSDIQKVVNSDAMDNILIGRGVFTTTDPEVAKIYGEKVFEIQKPTDNEKVFDLTKATDNELKTLLPKEFFTEKIYDKTAYETYKESIKDNDIADAEDIIVEALAEKYLPEGITWEEAQSGGDWVTSEKQTPEYIRDHIVQDLKDAGYDWWKHKGGLRVGKKEHDVYVAINDNVIKPISVDTSNYKDTGAQESATMTGDDVEDSSTPTVMDEWATEIPYTDLTVEEDTAREEPKRERMAWEPTSVTVQSPTVGDNYKFHEPTIGKLITPKTQLMRQIGAEDILGDIPEAKGLLALRTIDINHRIQKIMNEINKDVTIKEKFKNWKTNTASENEQRFRNLLDNYEKAPSFLSQPDKKIFNDLRDFTRELLKITNVFRKAAKLPPINSLKEYVPHFLSSVARAAANGKYPYVEDVYRWTGKRVPPGTNPTAKGRTVSKVEDLLNEVFSKDLGKLLKAMAKYDLRDIYIAIPYEQVRANLKALEGQIPTKVVKEINDYLDYDILDRPTALDELLNRTLLPITNKINPALIKHFNRVITDPVRTLSSAYRQGLMLGAIAGKPQLITRNLFQRLLTMDLYPNADFVKAQFYAPKWMMDEIRDTTFYKLSTKKFEDLPAGGKIVNAGLWLYGKTHAGFTYLSNVDVAMRTGYNYGQRMVDFCATPRGQKYIQDFAAKHNIKEGTREYDKLSWKEGDQIKEAIEAGSLTQWLYFQTDMPLVFRGQSGRALFALQSWSMNFFGKHVKEMMNRSVRGISGSGRIVRKIDRGNAIKGMAIIAAITAALERATGISMGKFLLCPFPTMFISPALKTLYDTGSLITGVATDFVKVLTEGKDAKTILDGMEEHARYIGKDLSLLIPKNAIEKWLSWLRGETSTKEFLFYTNTNEEWKQIWIKTGKEKVIESNYIEEDFSEDEFIEDDFIEDEFVE